MPQNHNGKMASVLVLPWRKANLHTFLRRNNEADQHHISTKLFAWELHLAWNFEVAKRSFYENISILIWKCPISRKLDKNPGMPSIFRPRIPFWHHNQWVFVYRHWCEENEMFFVSHEVWSPATSDRRSRVAGNGTEWEVKTIELSSSTSGGEQWAFLNCFILTAVKKTVPKLRKVHFPHTWACQGPLSYDHPGCKKDSHALWKWWIEDCMPNVCNDLQNNGDVIEYYRLL